MASNDDFLAWFKSQGGEVSPDVGIHVFSDEEGGRGLIALKELQIGETLFSVPRSLLLSPKTCELPRRMGEGDWKRFNLSKGWSGLILCMMWEEAKGAESKWAGYFPWMPTTFSTLMFWSDEELAELKGSGITEKIGKEDADREYNDRVLPAIQACVHVLALNVARPDLFLPSQAEHYTLQKFHIAGSRILSRSFTVHDLADEAEEAQAVDAVSEDGDEAPQLIESAAAAVPVANDRDGDVEMQEAHEHDDEPEPEEEEEDSDDEDERATTLVPMADMLNARSGFNNARLYHERDCLRMCAITTIPAGCQLWNTYGDCANEDLLRRYGFVDLVPLEDGTLGNPADIAEVKADLVVKIAAVDASEVQERIDWWLDLGGDDTFDIERTCDVPQAMTSFSKLLLMPREEWEKTQQKDKPPKPKPDTATLALAVKVLRARLAEYPTTLEEDEALFPTLDPATQWKKRNAVAVRLGEKRILTGTLRRCEEMERSIAGQGSSTKGKRKGDENGR
ncbi:SET domain-containing protein, partial [Exidia glandulosa HHB12029]